jgi:hypothetical protein
MEPNWEAIGAVGETLGAVGVIATLVYLARQIRENSQQMKVGSVISINHLMNEAFDPIYISERNIEIWTRGQVAPNELSDKDRAVFSLFMSRLVNVLLTAFSQSRYETLDSEEFSCYVGTLKSLLETPGGQEWLATMGGNDLLTDEAREAINTTDVHQRSIVWNRDESGDT